MFQDSRLFVWSVDGSLQKCWKTHQGASVWSVDCSKEKNLIVRLNPKWKGKTE